MINFKWLTVFDIRNNFRVTQNVPENEIDIAVNDAYTFDIVPVVSDTLMQAIKDILITNPKQWSASKTYAVNDIIIYDGVYYKAAQISTDSVPTSVNANWNDLEIMDFWLGYVKPYFIACAYFRFMLWHGVNVTQYGIRAINEDTSIDISDKTRGDIMSDIKSKKNLFLSRLNKEFSDSANTFDGTQYSVDIEDNSTPNNDFGIFAVGVNRNKKRKSLDDGCC